MSFFSIRDGRRPGREFLPPFFFFSVAALLSLGIASCASLGVKRPVQEMSDTVAALRAAKEVSADTLAPDLYRRANEAYLKARNEYRFKNFIIAKDYALRAKKLAEEAEYQALKQGATRTSSLPAEEPPPPPPEPYDYPTPRGTPGFLLDSEEAKQQAAPPTSTDAAPPATP